ncbi:hypothetical protein ACTWJ8_15570 [Streptomyces sp. SDT5-1]|uniref:hypothetical protein n=1 Tax=Streptomyces sp. SDT5-1 TaxID=3406418 RepID=UPI003FD65606
MAVLRAGFFREGNEDADPATYSESLVEAVNRPTMPDEEQVLAYLKGGVEFFSTMGAEKDALTGDEYIGGAGSLRTDGTWVWPVDLEHYIRRHHAVIPDDFHAHIRAHNYRAPAVSDDRVNEIADEWFPPRPSPWANRRA